MASGIICEYNPFHRGHCYHFEETRRLSGDPDIICIMSGNYTQRGEPAITDKWIRAHMALASGADLVIELPTYYSTASAEYFAFGAVQLAHHAGIIDRLSFGVEPGTQASLRIAAELLTSRFDAYETRLRAALISEKSFPRAREIALTSLMNEAGITPSPSFFSPNAILGLEYLRQLKHPDVSPNLRSLMIERESSEYASLDITQRFPSAAALRDKLLHHEDITSLLPSSAQPLWREAVNRGLAPVFPASFSPALHYALSFRTWDSLCEIAEINEDLAHRIEKASAEYASWDTLLHSLSGKTYPTARLRRILLNIVLNITQEGRAATDFAVSPPYLRVLGYRREKEFLLKDLVRHATLPVITSLSHLPPLSSAAARALQDEIRFTDLYCAALPSPAVRGRGYEYRAPLLVV